jgi:hypothetical protein
MATVEDLAARSLRLVLVKSSTLALTTQEKTDYMDALNDYMTAIEADGVRVGYTVATAVTDEVTVPASCLRGIVANMAIEVASEYNAPIPPGVARMATEGLKTMRRVGRQSMRSRYPVNLPLGSGHQHDIENSAYAWGIDVDTLLSFQSATTAFTASDTPVPVEGQFIAEYSRGFRVDITGLLKFQEDDVTDVTFRADLIATGNADYTFHIYQNGASIYSVTSTLGASDTAIFLSKNVSAYPGDEFQLYVENDTDTASCVVRGRFSAIN